MTELMELDIVSNLFNFLKTGASKLWPVGRVQPECLIFFLQLVS